MLIYENSISLCHKIMEKYGIPKESILRTGEISSGHPADLIEVPRYPEKRTSKVL